jgi:hypothetical protein
MNRMLILRKNMPSDNHLESVSTDTYSRTESSCRSQFSLNSLLENIVEKLFSALERYITRDKSAYLKVSFLPSVFIELKLNL